MKIAEIYIAKTILAAIALISLMLIGFQLFILGVNELDSLGRGNYHFFQMFGYILLQMPYHVYLFFPMASLLGCLAGLGVLANNRELVAMRAAGFSIKQITLGVIKAAFLCIILVTLLGELLFPHLSEYANDIKMDALANGKAMRTSKGLWLKEGRDYIHITEILPDYSLKDIMQLRFDENLDLILARKIKQLQLEKNHWTALDMAETRFFSDHTEQHLSPKIQWDTKLSPKILKGSMNEPDEMSLPELQQYLRAQKLTRQHAYAYQLAFWQRLSQPLATLVMMILAIPFIFGPLRSSSMGAKFLIGASFGFAFHLLNHFLGPFSQVMQWPAIIAAIGPTLIFALLGTYLLRRVR